MVMSTKECHGSIPRKYDEGADTTLARLSEVLFTHFCNDIYFISQEANIKSPKLALSEMCNS